MDVRVGLWRKLSTKNWCFWTVVLEKTLESPLDCKEIQPVHLKGDQSWVFIGRTDAKLKLQYFGHLMRRVDSLGKTLMQEGLGSGGEGDDRGWDAWMASLTRWAWVWVNSGSWWWTGRPGVLRFMGSQRVGHNWVTELNWTDKDPYWNSWCYRTISLSVSLSSFFLQSFQHHGLFQWVSCGPNIIASASTSVCPISIYGWFPLGLTSFISLLSKDSQESSPAPQFESICSRSLAFFMAQLFLVQLSPLFEFNFMDLYSLHVMC